TQKPLDPSLWTALKKGLHSVKKDWRLHFDFLGLGGPGPQQMYKKKPGKVWRGNAKKKWKRKQILFSLEYPLMILAAPLFNIGKAIYVTAHTYNQQQFETLTYHLWRVYGFSDETSKRIAKLLLRWEDMTADDILDDISDDDRHCLPPFFEALEDPETPWPVPIVRP